MTCINLVNPNELPDQLLFIEYRGLPKVFERVRSNLEKGKTLHDLKIPNSYKFGEGHMTFFYNKLKFLVQRQKELSEELIRRGWNISNTEIIDISDIPVQFQNNFIPSDDDINLSRDKLRTWINESNHYRWTNSTKPIWL